MAKFKPGDIIRKINLKQNLICRMLIAMILKIDINEEGEHYLCFIISHRIKEFQNKRLNYVAFWIDEHYEKIE